MIFTPHWFHPHYDRTSIHDDPKDPTDLSASFCSSVAHLSKIETWRNAGKKRPKVEVSLVATRNLVSPTTPTMNSPSQKIHSCSKGGPDFGLTNLCYHVLVSDSVILPSHDYSSNVDLLKWWGSRSDEADLGGFWWSWPKKSVPFKMTSSQDLQQKLQGQLPRLQFEVLCENSQVTVSESSDLEFKCISASIYIYTYIMYIYIYVYACWWLMVFSKFLQCFTSFVGPPNLPHHETHQVQGTRVKSSTLKPGRAPSSHPKHSVLVKANFAPREELVGLEEWKILIGFLSVGL